MARIAGIDLPRNKVGPIGLSYIYGIGRFNAVTILNSAGVDVNKKLANGVMKILQLFVKLLLKVIRWKVSCVRRFKPILNDLWISVVIEVCVTEKVYL